MKANGLNMRFYLGLALFCLLLEASLSQQTLEENLSGGIRQFTTRLLSDLGKFNKLFRLLQKKRAGSILTPSFLRTPPRSSKVVTDNW